MLLSRMYLARSLVLLTVFLLIVSPVPASEVYSYDITFKHGGEDRLVHVRSWKPDTVPIRGVLYLPPCLGGDTRGRVSNVTYQRFAESMGFAMIGMKDRDGWTGKYQGTNETEVRGNVQAVLDEAASGLSCPQISNAPMAFYGFSKGGWMDAVLASYMPERTICFTTDKSGTWLSSISDEAVFVPGMCIDGKKDATAGTHNPFYAFNVWRNPKGGEVSLAVDWNVGHSRTDFSFVEAFIGQCTSVRYPQGQLPSDVPGNPLQLNQVPVSEGWLVETSYDTEENELMWIRDPETEAYNDYHGEVGTASWTPTQTMAMVLRSHNASDSQTGEAPIRFSALTAPTVDDCAYEVGDTLQLMLRNYDLPIFSIKRVQVFHEEELLTDVNNFTLGCLYPFYTFSERGVHTFWTKVTYDDDGQDIIASDSFTVIVVPEPATFSLLAVLGVVLLHRRENRKIGTVTLGK